MSPKQSNKLSNHTNLVSNQESRTKPAQAVKQGIDLLFGSGTRVDLLWVYLTHPDQWLTPHHLAKLTGRSPSDVVRNNRILADLELIEPYPDHFGGSCAPRNLVRNFNAMAAEEEIFKDSFILNKRHPWIPPLRLLLESSIGSLSILSEAIRKIPDIEVAFVFGSFATSEQTPLSDIDLMVIGKHSLMTLAEPMSAVEKRIGREINYIAYSPEDWQNKFKERHHFVASLMGSPKIFIVGDAAKLEQITVPFLNET